MSRKLSYCQVHSTLFLWVCLVGVLLALSGCADEPVKRDYPKIRTLEVTNITGNGATFIAEVIDEGTVPIAEHGFTWSLFTPDMTSDERIFLGSFSGTGRFEAEISTALTEGITYEVCAFVKAGEYTVYGDKVKFMSLGSGAPEVTDFMPKSAGWGDTVTISGRKFSHLNITNKILIDECMCVPFYASDTLLKFVLPTEVIKPENSLAVSIHGNVATATGKLTLIPPEAYGFTPGSGRWGDTITLTGRNLSGLGRQPGDGLILNGTLKCPFVMIRNDSASFLIPGQLEVPTSSVTLSYNTFVFSFPETLTLAPPGIDSISPVEGTWGTSVVLYGKFNNISARNKVLFGDKQAQILTSSYDSLVVKVPDNLTSYESMINYTSGSYICDFPQIFKLLEPEITDFEPKQGYVGNLVTIRGKYFRNNATTVKIGGISANVKSANDSVITCYVPGDVWGDCTLEVTVLGHTAVAGELFISMNHIITDVTPLEAIYGDTITLTGTNFKPGTVLILGSKQISPLSIMENEMKFIVPQSLYISSYTIRAKYSYWIGSYLALSNFVYPEPLRLKEFTISDVEPLSGEKGDLITITGTDLSFPVVTFGVTEAEVVEATRERLTVRVPTLPAGDHIIKVTIGSKTYQHPTVYSHTGPWRTLPNLPFLFKYGCVFDFGEELYVATGGATGTNIRDIYLFDQTVSGFSKQPGQYPTAIINPISCTLDGKGYIIGYKGYGQPLGFEIFNPDSLTWRALPDYPGTNVANLCLVADDSVIYAGCGENMAFNIYEWYKDFWKYSPATNRWTRLADSPMNISFTNHIFIDGRLLFLGFHDINNGPRCMLEYLPLTDTWIQNEIKEEDIGTWGWVDIQIGGRVSLIDDGKWYIGFGDWRLSFDPGYSALPNLNNRFYCFDPVTNTWKTISNVVSPPRTFALSFTSGGKIYIGGSQVLSYYDFWEYDPQLDQ